MGVCGLYPTGEVPEDLRKIVRAANKMQAMISRQRKRSPRAVAIAPGSSLKKMRAATDGHKVIAISETFLRGQVLPKLSDPCAVTAAALILLLVVAHESAHDAAHTDEHGDEFHVEFHEILLGAGRRTATIGDVMLAGLAELV